MILRNKRFDSRQGKILENLYNRLLNMERGVVEEDSKLRERMINKLCEVSTNDDLDIILKGIESLLREKKSYSSDGR